MIGREFRMHYLQGGTFLSALSFFAIGLFCVSLALGPEKKMLSHGMPVVLWVLAILTTLFSAPLLLKMEAQGGLFDEILLHSSPLSFYLLGKIGRESLLFGLPLVSIGAFLTFLYGLSLSEVAILSLTLLIGFPALSALGIFGGFLTLHAQGGGVLLGFIILPLTLPLLLLGLSVMETTRLGFDSSASFCLFTSLSIVLVILCVAGGTWALRFAVEG